ncbi:hypothetical protein [Kineococcus xinjiangensis]|uniref:hypothetical protein n=1 Tax=Kineococcus xinjiangensis TaxID=512762 RepID=UPI0011B02757|nr:hypothetical protein [Kineococcus xinjiangensis]
MADPTEVTRLEEEAETQWLTRLVAAPDAWRTRGATAGGLLGAATAATLAIALNSPSLEDNVLLRSAVAAALLFFTLAVVLFLVASVYPSPKAPSETTNFAEEVKTYCENEARPIRGFVTVGAVSAVLAVAATLVAATIAFWKPSDEWKQIRVLGGADRQELVDACPALKDVVTAQVEGGVGEPFVLKVRRGVCGEAETSFRLDDPDVSIMITAVP